MHERLTANKVILDSEVATSIFGILVDLLSCDEALLVLEHSEASTADGAVQAAIDVLAALQSALME